MKRFAFAMLSVCAVSASGCCGWPGYWSPFGGGCQSGGCQNGQCAPQMYGTSPTGWQTGAPVMNGSAPVALSPMYEQQVAYPQQLAPTMAVESLPTYR